MVTRSIAGYIKDLRRHVFTTADLSRISGKSLSTTSQSLKFLEEQRIVNKIYRGIWVEAGDERASAYSVIPYQAGDICSPSYRPAFFYRF